MKRTICLLLTLAMLFLFGCKSEIGEPSSASPSLNCIVTSETDTIYSEEIDTGEIHYEFTDDEITYLKNALSTDKSIFETFQKGFMEESTYYALCISGAVGYASENNVEKIKETNDDCIFLSDFKENGDYGYYYALFEPERYEKTVLYFFYKCSSENPEYCGFWGYSLPKGNAAKHSLSSSEFKNISLEKINVDELFETCDAADFSHNYINVTTFLDDGYTAYCRIAFVDFDSNENYLLCEYREINKLNALEIIQTEDMPEAVIN